MKLCIIGARGHQGYVFSDLPKMPHVRLVGISTGSPEDDIERLRQTCGEHGKTAQAFEDYRQMMDEAKPDVISIAGPFEQHAEMSVEALQRGIHVFCEKPVATTLEDLAKLRKTHAQTDLHLAGMMGLRYDPAFYTAWRAVQDGIIGAVRLLNTQKSYKLGTRPDYYRDRQTYGGTIPWVGSHAIDWVHWFSRESFVSVHASHTTQHNRGHGDLEMSALCQFTLTNDVFASTSVDYFRPGNAPSHGDDRARVVGTEGVIEVRGGEIFVINSETNGEENLPPTCDRSLFHDFVAHAAGSNTSLLGAEDTFAVTEACLLARESADTRRVISFDKT